MKPAEVVAPPPEMPPRPRSESSRRHGGAWKVAYADFVTALLALFIVLWLMNSTEAVKKHVSGYFRDPRGYTKTLGAGPGSAGSGLAVDHHTARDLQHQIEMALHRMPEFDKFGNNLQMSVTGEGLRIDLLETEQGVFFPTGSASPTDAAGNLLRVLGAELGKMPNRIVIEGHTDARAFRRSESTSLYGNWELSVDRGNAARRLLYTFGVRPGQVVEVCGFADQKLLIPSDPDDPRNRRVSVVVKFE